MSKRFLTDGAGQQINAALTQIKNVLNGAASEGTPSASSYTSKDFMTEETGRAIAETLSLILQSISAMNAPSFYGTCSTAASTAAKVVACKDFKLAEGRRIAVKFSNYNTASSPTLNVNGTGAKSIKSYGTTNDTLVYRWRAGEVVDFVYDGTNWLLRMPAVASGNYYGTVRATTLNGAENTDPSFYAPTTSGNAGQILTSNGPGEVPYWVSPSAYSLPLAADGVRGGVQTGYSTNGRNYAVQLLNEKMFVNVPWTDTNTTYQIATESIAGLVKPISVIEKPTLQSVTTTSNRYYSVQMSSDGSMFVNVPWTDTSYSLPLATSSVIGGVKVGGTDVPSSGLYRLSLDDNGRLQLSSNYLKPKYAHYLSFTVNKLAGGAVGILISNRSTAYTDEDLVTYLRDSYKPSASNHPFVPVQGVYNNVIFSYVYQSDGTLLCATHSLTDNEFSYVNFTNDVTIQNDYVMQI